MQVNKTESSESKKSFETTSHEDTELNSEDSVDLDKEDMIKKKHGKSVLYDYLTPL